MRISCTLWCRYVCVWSLKIVTKPSWQLTRNSISFNSAFTLAVLNAVVIIFVTTQTLSRSFFHSEQAHFKTELWKISPESVHVVKFKHSTLVKPVWFQYVPCVPRSTITKPKINVSSLFSFQISLQPGHWTKTLQVSLLDMFATSFSLLHWNVSVRGENSFVAWQVFEWYVSKEEGHSPCIVYHHSLQSREPCICHELLHSGAVAVNLQCVLRVQTVRDNANQGHLALINANRYAWHCHCDFTPLSAWSGFSCLALALTENGSGWHPQGLSKLGDRSFRSNATVPYTLAHCGIIPFLRSTSVVLETRTYTRTQELFPWPSKQKVSLLSLNSFQLLPFCTSASFQFTSVSFFEISYLTHFLLPPDVVLIFPCISFAVKVYSKHLCVPSHVFGELKVATILICSLL